MRCMSGARGCWSDVLKSLLARLGLTTEGTTTPLRRQRATATPSTPVTAPAEQISSCVRGVQGVQRRDQSPAGLSSHLPSRLAHAPAGLAAEGFTVVVAEHREQAGGHQSAAHCVPRAVSASRQQLLCITGPCNCICSMTPLTECSQTASVATLVSIKRLHWVWLGSREIPTRA